MDYNTVTFTITLDGDDLAYLNSSIPEYEFFFTPVPKLRECLANSFRIIQDTKCELVNFFTYDEVLLIAAATEDSISCDWRSAKESLISDVSIYYSDSNTDIPFNVIQADILSKLDKLTKHQAYCVYQMCFEYWEIDEFYRTDTDEELKRVFQVN